MMLFSALLSGSGSSDTQWWLCLAALYASYPLRAGMHLHLTVTLTPLTVAMHTRTAAGEGPSVLPLWQELLRTLKLETIWILESYSSFCLYRHFPLKPCVTDLP